jgi:AraC-like DNA-binding protein
MKHWYQRPPQSMTDYVRTILILEGFSQPNPEEKPLFTNGMPCLYCLTEKTPDNYENVVQLTLYGKSTPPECWAIDEPKTIVVYFFYPFALQTVFNVSASQLMKEPIELGSWSPHKINALRAQLAYATSTSQKIAVLDHVLTQQINLQAYECAIVKHATDFLMNNTNTDALPDLLKELNINPRTFQRTFKKYVGITASQYRRICQFELSFAQVRTKQFEKLADIAYENGFADQSHFIRLFKEFAHTTPNDYLKSGLKEKSQ